MTSSQFTTNWLRCYCKSKRHFAHRSTRSWACPKCKKTSNAIVTKANHCSRLSTSNPFRKKSMRIAPRSIIFCKWWRMMITRKLLSETKTNRCSRAITTWRLPANISKKAKGGKKLFLRTKTLGRFIQRPRSLIGRYQASPNTLIALGSTKKQIFLNKVSMTGKKNRKYKKF